MEQPQARAAVDCGETGSGGCEGGDCGGKGLWRKARQAAMEAR